MNPKTGQWLKGDLDTLSRDHDLRTLLTEHFHLPFLVT